MINEARKKFTRELQVFGAIAQIEGLKRDHWLVLVRFVTQLIDKLELDQPALISQWTIAHRYVTSRGVKEAV